MDELLTAAQMRAIEAAAIASGTVTGQDLMERAGRGVVAAIFEVWPELGTPAPALAGAHEYLNREDGRRTALVLSGPGNNGGDGFVVARLLAQLGWAVEVYFLGDPARLPRDAAENHRRWLALGPLNPWHDVAVASTILDRAKPIDLLVDALFGIGISRPLGPSLAQTRDAITAAVAAGPAPRVLAVDVPSGVSGDTGDAFGAWPAHVTVTFHRLKHGHRAAAAQCGRVVVKDIGL
ncbi:MAG: NAD(P)H-hydrate epimerase [Pseudomonadota bacterium]